MIKKSQAITGNHLADQAQVAENKRGCCLECGRILFEVTICPHDGLQCIKDLCEPLICTKTKYKLYCPTCGVYFNIE